jgi:HEAT repeat protein
VISGFVLRAMLAARSRRKPISTPEGTQGVDPAEGKPSRSHVAAPEPEETRYSVPDTKALELAAFVDRNAKERVTADITSRIPRIRHEKDMPAVVSVLLDTKDDDTVRNEAVNLLRRSEYPGLTDDLIKVLSNPKEGARFRAFCIQHLWMNVEKADPAGRAKIGSELHEALSDRHIPVRREALLALVRMRDPKGRETAVEWLAAEKADGLRDAAIRCVRELGLREHIPTIRKYLRDKSDVVRIVAIVTLSEWGDEESRPAIEEAAKSGSFRLRRSGEMALKRLNRAADANDGTAPDAKTPEAVPPKAAKPEIDF